VIKLLFYIFRCPSRFSPRC